MAAKQQGKRKVRDAKRKKILKKHQLAKRKQKQKQKQKQKKLQPRKQKKHQAHRVKRRVKQSSAPRSVDSGPERICSPRLFAAKVLRQMPKVRMEAKARSLMKTLLTDVYDHVATEVENLSQTNELSNISGTDVQAALKEAMTKELAKHSAESASTECV